MKVNVFANVSRSERTGNWQCMLLPTIGILRDDVFEDEAAYYVVFHWLLFQVYVRILKKK